MEKMLSLQSKKNNSATFWHIVIFAVMTVVLLVVHALIQPDFGDDLVYAQVWARQPLFVFLRDRYNEWSSRVVIEAVMMPLAASSAWLWRVLDTCVILLLVWITGDLFAIPRDKAVEASIIFFILMWSVPMRSLSNAGWVTTTVNYLWPLTFGMVALRPIRHWLLDEVCPRWEYFICPLCVIYSANMEQMCAILLGVYLVFGAYLLIRRKRLSVFYLIQLFLIFASLCFILTAPGNAVRTVQETKNYFPGFENMHVGQKLFMGFLDNMHYYVSGGPSHDSRVFVILSGVLLLNYVVLRAKREKRVKFWEIAVVSVPFVTCCLILFLFRFLLYDVEISRGRNLLGVFIENANIQGQSYFSRGMIALQAAVYFAVLLCTVVSVWILHGKSSETLLELLILAAGFASRMIMGFSPTIYASGDRTALFCSMAILIVTLRNIQFFKYEGHKSDPRSARMSF